MAQVIIDEVSYSRSDFVEFMCKMYRILSLTAPLPVMHYLAFSETWDHATDENVCKTAECLGPELIAAFKRFIAAKNATRETIISECWSCKYRQDVPGNCHISCGKPDIDMVGNQHGIESGWFFYPILFDPVWKEKGCDNYEKVQ